MLSRLTLVSTFLILFLVSELHAQDSGSWVQRANQGPETPKTATKVWYEMIGTTLRITFVVDSTDPGNYIYMILNLPAYHGKDSYTLNSTTYYQYGNRSDQRTVLTSGSCTITDIDNNTNDVFGDFSWTGKANLQNGITLTQTITQGKFKVRIKSDLEMVSIPGDSAKFKRDKDIKIKIFAQDKLDKNRFLPNIEITFKHDGKAFEGDQEIKKNTGLDGSATFDLHVKENAQGGDYSYSVQGKSDKTNDSPVKTVPFKVEESDRYYYTKCAGVSNTEFDAGEGKIWEEDGETAIVTTGTDIRLAGLLKMDGTVRIDTVGGRANVTGSGKVYFDGVWLDGIVQPFYLYNGPIAFFVPPCEAEIDFLTSELASRLTGGKLKSAKLRFLGNGVSSTGATVTCGMELGENAKEGCNDEVPFGTVWSPNKKAEAELSLGFLSNGANTDFTASGTIKNFSPVANWCLKETTLSYDGAKSEIGISAKAKTPLFDNASASVVFKDATLNAFAVDFELAKCVPIPNIPSVCWKGGGFSVENLWIGNPIKGRVNAKFGPIPPLDRTYLLTIDAGHQDPPAITDGGVTVQLIEVPELSSEKPFQGEVGGRVTIEWAKAKATIKASGGLLHLGGDYFLTGDVSGSLGFNPVMIAYEVNGSFQFPKAGDDVVEKMGFFSKFLAQAAPVPLGKASGKISVEEGGAQTVSLTYDMRSIVPPAGGNTGLYNALRDIGHGTLTVDLTRLPSPAAFEFDGGFTKLIGGFFNQVEKSGDAVQAADQTFTVTEGQESLLAMIASSTTDLPSTLKDPSGNTYTASDEAKHIHKVYSEDKDMTLWVVGQPEPGIWTLSAPSAAVTDSFLVAATVVEPTFKLSASVVGDQVIAEWTGENLPADGIVRVYLGSALDEKGGAYAGQTSVTNGTITLPLTDSTADCEFSVYATMTALTGVADDVADALLSNPLADLPSPENASAVSDQNGNTTITWAPVTDGRVAAVAVFDADADTVVAAAYNFDVSTGVTIPNHDGRMLVLRNVDKRGILSCPTDVVTVVTGVEEEGLPISSIVNGVHITIRPHPVVDQASITLDGLVGESASIQIVDMLGRIVVPSQSFATTTGRLETTINLSSMPQGSYVLVIHDRGRVVSHLVVVGR